MSQQANATAPRNHPHVARTFAMTVVGAGCWAMVAGVWGRGLVLFLEDGLVSMFVRALPA